MYIIGSVKKLSLLFVTLSLVLVAGCAQQNKQPPPSFNVSPDHWFFKGGNNAIRGSAFVRTQGGSVVNCAGNEVFAFPVTTYGNRIMRSIFGNRSLALGGSGGYLSARSDYNLRRLSIDPKFFEFGAKTVCDVQGYFSLRNLADGGYFVFTQVIWRVGTQKQGGYMMLPVRVSGGQTVEVVLSP